MRGYLAVAGCFLIVLILGIVVMTNWDAEKPIKGVKVTVVSGNVEFKGKSGKYPEKIAKGEILAVDSYQTITRSSAAETTSTTEETDKLATAETQPAGSSSPVSLKLTVKDTEGQIYYPANVSIQSGSRQQTLPLSKSGLETIQGLQTGLITLAIADPQIFPASPATTVLQDGTNTLEMIVNRKTHFSAYIKNEQSQPIQNAVIILTPTREAQKIPQVDLSGHEADANGYFKYDPIVSGKYILSVSAPPYPLYEETVAAQTKDAPVTITLSMNCQIIAAVRDEDGKPVFSTQVTLRSTKGNKNITAVNIASEPTGDAIFNSVPAGKYNISAIHPWFKDEGQGHIDVEVNKNRVNVKLILKSREYAISGKVFEKLSGNPVVGAEVIAFNQKVIDPIKFPKNVYDGWNDKYLIQPDAKTITQSDGTFRLQSLKGGSYAVGISPLKNYAYVSFVKDYQYGTSNPVVFLSDKAEVKGVDIPLLPNWTISGRVLSKDGTPIENAEVKLHSEYNDKLDFTFAIENQLGFKQEAKSQTDGTYKYIGNAYIYDKNFKLFLSAFHNKYRGADYKEALHLEPGKELTGIDIVYGFKCIVKGRVIDKKNSPLGGVQIFIGTDDAAEIVYTEDNGHYEAYMAPGTYHIAATKKEYKGVRSDQPLILEEGKIVEYPDIVLEKGTDQFSGWVTDNEGTPAKKIQVNLNYRGGSGSAETDDKGYFQITPFDFNYNKSSTYIFWTAATDQYNSTTYETPEWDAQNIRITVQRYNEGFGQITGKILDDQHNSISRFEIQLIPTKNRLHSENAIYIWQSVSNPQGVFLINQVPVSDGPFVVAARSKDHAPAFSDVIQLQKDQTISVNVVLRGQTFTLTGLVTDNNAKPLKNAKVMMKSLPLDGISPYQMNNSAWNSLDQAYPNSLTDEQGAFRLSGVPVRGGELWVFNGRGWIDNTKTIIKVNIGSPNEERNLGTIRVESSSPNK